MSIIPINRNPLCFSGMPQLQTTFGSYLQPLTFIQVTKSIVNFQVVETQSQVNFQGAVQPMTGQQLEMKPHGQREWIWNQIHADTSVVLNIDDIILIGASPFRVMVKIDYSSYGFIEYHVANDYTLSASQFITTEGGIDIETESGSDLETEGGT